MPIFTLLILILCICLSIYTAWYNSPKQKGKRGEHHVSRILSQLPTEYQVLNDIMLPTEKGTTQIDHLVISKYGIFAIETKNYTGDIYGDDERKEWTQIIVTEVRYRRKWWKVYTYVTKNQFYSPIKQAYGHAYRVKDLLKDYRHLPIIPIVVFAGGADLSKVYSRNHVIYEEQLLDIISSYRNVYLSDRDFSNVLNILQNSNVRQFVDDDAHVWNLRKARQEARNTIESGVCPKCGGKLIQRKGKYGIFLGCSNYPKCKFTHKS